MNLLIQSGRLTRDIEVKDFNGSKVTYFSIAISMYNGKEYVSNFYNWAAYGKTAENMAKTCKKGNMVLLQGNETTTQAEDRNGTKIEQTRRTATAFELLTPREKTEEATEYNPNKKGIENFYDSPKGVNIDIDNDLPF